MLQANPSSRRPPIDMRPELVAPTASWLIHEDCPANGQFFQASSARIASVFMGVASGYQAKPDDFTIEMIGITGPR
jgi:hypothetical protein